ncbi:MAG: DNA-3-methyladenine glycosylase I [Bacillota bacterium]|nr:DNA-3-methyladenine glycosylase I [Bacillota bacterium]
MTDNLTRCPWANKDPLSRAYHDQVWARPVYDDRKLFKFLSLELMQAGLSWSTILKKAEGLDQAFDNFNPDLIASYEEEKIQALMNNPEIIRNQRKIRAVVTNAKAYKNLLKDFGSLSAYLWAFVDNKPIINSWQDQSQVPAKTDLSERISKDMKARGFSFLGPTIIYSFMQAVGLVNDHLLSCDFRDSHL